MRNRAVPIGVVVAALTSGCGTVTNLTDTGFPSRQPGPNEWGIWDARFGDKPGQPLRLAYGGVRGEWAAIAKVNRDNLDPFVVVVVALNALDLPFTLLGDTITLPYTIPADVCRDIGDYYFPPSKQPGAAADPPPK